MKLIYMVVAAGLIAGILYINMASKEAVVTLLSGVLVPFVQMDIDGLNVFALLLTTLGLVCFMALRK